MNDQVSTDFQVSTDLDLTPLYTNVSIINTSDLNQLKELSEIQHELHDVWKSIVQTLISNLGNDVQMLADNAKALIRKTHSVDQ